MLKTHFGYILHRSYCDSAFKFISGELFHPDHFHVKAVTNLLAGVHNQLNLPWGTSIATTSILVRTVAALPLYICAERNQAKVAHVAVDCLKNRQLLTAKLTNSDYYRHLSSGTQMLLENRMFRSIFLKICQDNGCHPLKSAVTGIIQIPLWLTFTFSLRYMSGYSLYPQCDLVELSAFRSQFPSAPCTSFLLPTACALGGLANVELAYLRRPLLLNPKDLNSVEVDPFSYKVVRLCGWLGNLLLFICCSFVPKALVIYWCTSTIHQLCMHLLVMHPCIRRLFGLWTLPHEGPQPYKFLLNSMCRRYSILRWLRSKRSNQE